MPESDGLFTPALVFKPIREIPPLGLRFPHKVFSKNHHSFSTRGVLDTLPKSFPAFEFQSWGFVKP